MPDPGTAYDLHGATALPPWMNACTIKPYLIKDGSQYSTSAYPYLFERIGYTFGGSGSNFNVPDERARARIAYDPNGTGRLNNGIISGTTMGSAGGNQNMQQHNHSVSGSIGDSYNAGNFLPSSGTEEWVGGPPFGTTPGGTNITIPGSAFSWSGSIGNSGSGSGQNIQPSIVSFLPLIKT